MLTRLELTNFKNFKSAALNLGPFNLLIGANASGKSNLRDAFRFLHALGRGYSLPEIFGEKWGDSGELQWGGLRGGRRETVFFEKEIFTIKTHSTYFEPYEITVKPRRNGDVPIVTEEKITITGDMLSSHIWERNEKNITHSFLMEKPEPQYEMKINPNGSTSLIMQKINKNDVNDSLFQTNESPPSNSINFPGYQRHIIEFFQPLIASLHKYNGFYLKEDQLKNYENFINDLTSMRFFDFLPDSLRKSSMPGQIVLGDRGEKLSSVIQHIINDPVKKRILLYWLQALTPMDVSEIEFEYESSGKISLVLVEKNGMRVSVHSASDGTLRFLAMLAAFLGPKPPRLCFIEELETGIHPTRQHLLIDFLERIADEGKTQIIATTHSPQLLSFLSEKNRPYVSLLYRHENQPDARIIRLVDLPDALRVFETDSLGELHASGWFEDMASCMNEDIIS